MASSAIPASPTLPLDMHIICSICMEVFVDPVTTACGHSFCKKCLDFSFRYSDSACPLCKTLHSKTPEVNIVLRDIVQQLKATMVGDEDLYTGKDGEVPCDICTQMKRKAHKSCLVCLESYCSAHLGNHCSSKRLKGHKLVAPVKNLDERACLKHGRPLELYDRKQQKCICVRCLDEGPEDVVSTEQEWDKKKAELENTKMQLNDNIEKRKTKMAEISSSRQICKEQLDSEWWEIDSVFTAIYAIVEEAQATALQPLIVRRQRVEAEAADLNEELEADIDKLHNAISELNRISTWEDHVLFLQSYPTLPHVDGDIRDLADVEFDTSLTFGTMRKTMAIMMEHIQQQLEKLTSIELARVSKFSVDVKLDPATAHQHRVLSERWVEVKRGGDDDSRERCGLSGNSLGVTTLTSGKSYWEVDVSNKAGWDLGLARHDADFKGKVSMNPGNGYRVTVHYDENKYAALTAPPVPIYLKEKPEKVGVFVDYEEGVVSFYNLTAQSHIHSFTQCSFIGDIYPYFGPHVKKAC